MILFILILLLIYLFITYLMFIFISKRFKEEKIMVMHKAIQKALEPYGDIIKEGTDWVEEKIHCGMTEDVYINSKDGTKLHGLYINNKKSKKLLILSHGYRSNPKSDLYSSCKYYYDMGYNLLLIDQRGTGKSEGNYITFGVKESEDLASWCNNYRDMNILLGGISMGATSSLMALRNIDVNVEAVIVDSPFVFPYDEVLYCIRHYFHLDGKIFIDMINVWCMLFAKYSLKEKNVICSLENKNIPILLIHGESDDFVPMINSKKIYDNYNGYKKFVTFPNASHGMSFLVDSKRYIKTISDFLNKK